MLALCFLCLLVSCFVTVFMSFVYNLLKIHVSIVVIAHTEIWANNTFVLEHFYCSCCCCIVYRVPYTCIVSQLTAS